MHTVGFLRCCECYMRIKFFSLTICTTVRNDRMISEAGTAKWVLFTCPSEIIFWQLTGEVVKTLNIFSVESFPSWSLVYSVSNAETLLQTSWNRIGKKRHTRNRLFALFIRSFWWSVLAFLGGSFTSREKWSFVQIRILYHLSHVEER